MVPREAWFEPIADGVAGPGAEAAMGWVWAVSAAMTMRVTGY